MAKPKKTKLTKKESEELLPIIREFNKIASAVTGLLTQRVESKERKVSVMVSRIKRPDQSPSQIRVQSVAFSKGFLQKQRDKKKKKKNQSEWDDNFSEKRGFLI
ncbi:MAG: hypothetical protein ACO3K7_01415 [Candidatus Marinamargulisbacteria bacterium]|jgi:negative regulator of genetic competence, sporulation and motility